MKYIKKQILHERKIQDRQIVINSDGSIELNPIAGKVKINGDLLVTGSSSGPTNSLTYYVSLEGSDTNDGLGAGPDRAKKTIKSAVEAAPPGATIQLAPGDFYENNPITLKERQTVRGDSLRNTQIYPLNNTLDIFYVDNACYIFQVTFRGLRDPGWCVRIKPGALVTVSPYVQNCTNMNGPWLNDGTEFIPFETVQIEGIQPIARPIINNENVPLGRRVNDTGGGNGMLVDGNEYDQRSLVFSMVADSFTQIAQGGIGFHITNFGYTQIVSCFSVFTRIGFLATKGGYLSISNSVSDFGTFAIIADGVFDVPYTTARPARDYFSTIGSISVTNPGAGYTSTPVVEIEPPTTPGGVTATAVASIDPGTGEITSVSISNPGEGYDFIPQVQFVGGGFTTPASAVANLITNRLVEVDSLRDRAQVGSIISFAGDSTKYYITAAEVLREPFIYDENICRRDVRRIVDAVVGDMVMGTNYQAIAAGRSYLRGTAGLVLQQQLTPTIFGIEAARDEMLARVPDSDPLNDDARYAIIEGFATIVNFLEQGDSTTAPDVFYENLITIDQDVRDSKDAVIANRNFIIDEITNYIAEQFSNLSYDQSAFENDIRSIMTSVAYDVALGTNYKSVTSGRLLTVTDRELVQKTAALTFVKNNTAQFSTVAADATALLRSNAAFDEIIDIVNNEIPSTIVYPNPVGASTTRITAKNQLQLNRTFIQAEVVAWVENEIATATAGSFWFNFLYDIELFERDLGFIVDALTYDIIYSGNTASRSASEAHIDGAIGQLGSNTQSTATVLAYRHLQTVVSQIVQNGQIIPSPGNDEIQDTSAGAALGIEADTLVALIEIIINVVDAGNIDNLVEADFPNINWAAESIQDATTTILSQRDNQAVAVTNYILNEYPDFTYNRIQFRSDMAGIVDAVARDIRLSTNHNSIVAGLNYRTQVDNELNTLLLPATILALRHAQKLYESAVAGNATALARLTARFEELLHVIEFSEPPTGVEQFFNIPPVAGIDLINAQRQLRDNRTFLVAETVAYITNQVNIATPGSIWEGYDYTEALDAGFVVDAISHDLIYEGNRSILITATTYYNVNGPILAPAQVEPTAQAIEHLRDVASQVIKRETVIKSPGNVEDQVVTTGAGTIVESNISESLFDILINAVRSGLVTTPSQINPNFSWVSIGIQEAVTNLLASDADIQDAVIDYITTKIIGFSYNTEKCERDTGYIIDAAVYDMMYGGNKQTRRAAEAYYNNVVIKGQEEITEFSYKRLAQVLDLVARNIPVTTSTGVTEIQNVSFVGIEQSIGGSILSGLVLNIAEVIRFGISALVTEIDHSYADLGNTDLNVSRLLILADLQAIEDEAIRLLNLEFGGEVILSIFPGLVSVTQGTLGTMVNVSTVSTAGHAFEYVGAGITYNALPFFGGSPIPENEFVESNDAKVFAGGTVDQIGNFRVGNFFNVNALDGSITLNAESINLQGLSSIGPFRRDGIPVGVELREVSDSTDLISSIGIADSNTAPTQNAVATYVENRYFNKNTGSTVLGPSTFEDDVIVNGDLNTTLSTFNLINDNANVINFGSGASTINIADFIGTTTIRNNLEVGGNLTVSGGTLTTVEGNFQVTINDNFNDAFLVSNITGEQYIIVDTLDGAEAITFGSDPVIQILNTTESTNKTNGALTVAGGVGIAKNLNVGGNVIMEGNTFSTSSPTLFLFNDSAGAITAFGDATEIEFGSSGIVPGNFTVNNDRIIFTSEYTMQIPKGGSGTRGAPNTSGQIRFNTDLSQFEGYDGIAWNTLGGVRDVDGDTYILAELTPASNDNTLFFYTGNLQSMTLTTSALTVANNIATVAINGTTASTSTTTGQLVVAGGVGIGSNLNVGGAIDVTGNATVDGNLTAAGSLSVGTNVLIDTVSLTGAATFTVPDNVVSALSVVEGTDNYFTVTTTDAAEKITFGSVPQIAVDNVSESSTITSGALTVAGGAGIAKNLNVGGSVGIAGSLAVGNDAENDGVTIFGDYFQTIPDNRIVAYEIKEGTSVYFRLETLNGSERALFGTAPQVEIQNTTDSTNSTTGALVVAGGAGIAANLNVGVDLTVGRNAVVENNLEVRGGNLTTDQSVFNLIDTTATTVNAFGTATDINIGAVTGTLTVANELTVFDSNKAVQLPVGTTANRPTAVTGQIRFNNETLVFEGYDGIAWGSLGGVKDVDQDTFIRPETSPGADNDTLEFFTAGALRMSLATGSLTVDPTVDTVLNSVTGSLSSTTGALVVAGGVGIAENLYIGGRIGGSLVINELSSDTLTINGNTVLIPNTVTLRTDSDNTTENSVLYPLTLEHRTSGLPAAGVGTGIQFTTQTAGTTFKNGGAVDVVALDVTGNQEDFDMVFRTMFNGAAATEKLRLSETLATFNSNIRLLGNTVSTDQTVFNLLNDAVTTLNLAGAATTISIGSATGTTTVNHNLTVTQTVTADALILTDDLEVQYGGTGVSTFTENGIVYGDTANPLNVTAAAGTSDASNSFQILTVTSDVDATPVWTDTIDGGEF